MSKIFRGRHLTASGSLPLSCAETVEFFPSVFPAENNYGDVFTAETFAECCGHVEMLPNGSLLWYPPRGVCDAPRFDNVFCFIASRDSRRWRKIPELQYVYLAPVA